MPYCPQASPAVYSEQSGASRWGGGWDGREWAGRGPLTRLLALQKEARSSAEEEQELSGDGISERQHTGTRLADTCRCRHWLTLGAWLHTLGSGESVGGFWEPGPHVGYVQVGGVAWVLSGFCSHALFPRGILGSVALNGGDGVLNPCPLVT